MKLGRLLAIVSMFVIAGAGVSGNTCVHEILAEFLDDHTTQAEPTIAAFKDLVIVAFVSTQHHRTESYDRSAWIAYARSEDGGISFCDTSLIAAAPEATACVNPTLAVSREGTFFLSFLHLGLLGPQVAVARSIDGGRTFSFPVLVSRPLGSSLVDLPHLALAPDRAEVVYVAWTDLLLRQVFFSRSFDGGNTFVAPVALTEGGPPKQFVRLAAGNHGLLYCLWLEPQARDAPVTDSWNLCSRGLLYWVYVCCSTDYGRSWSEKKRIASVRLPCDPSAALEARAGFIRGGIRSLAIPGVAVEPVGGRLYIALQSASLDGTNTDVFFLAVDANLEVVVPLTRVNDDATLNDQFMPALAVSPQGEVGILFYDRRLDRHNNDCDVYFARSLDGGMTFTNERITSVSFPVPPLVGQPSPTGHFDGLRRAGYFGDYISIAADSRFFYLVWTDARNVVRTPNYPQGRPDLDVYFIRIPTLLRN